MAASLLFTSRPSSAPLQPRHAVPRRRPQPVAARAGTTGASARPLQSRPAVPPFPLALATALVLLALLVAPERPRDQEAICQRQAGVEACRVW